MEEVLSLKQVFEEHLQEYQRLVEENLETTLGQIALRPWNDLLSEEQFAGLPKLDLAAHLSFRARVTALQSTHLACAGTNTIYHSEVIRTGHVYCKDDFRYALIHELCHFGLRGSLPAFDKRMLGASALNEGTTEHVARRIARPLLLQPFEDFYEEEEKVADQLLTLAGRTLPNIKQLYREQVKNAWPVLAEISPHQTHLAKHNRRPSW